jgi:glycosyltransferase involved in cell wall biosynthesis
MSTLDQSAVVVGSGIESAYDFVVPLENVTARTPTDVLDGAENSTPGTAPTGGEPHTPTLYACVAVITRTKNRPVLLKRALTSVSQQSFKDLVWVIINDGGERACVEAIADQARTLNVRTVVIHNPQSMGMEAASDKAIHAVDSEYIIIHDDDDSWHPAFLERTTGYLCDNPSYGGVVTHSMCVKETIASDTVRVIAQYPFNDWLKSIYLIDILNVNSFPPISFLYRRAAFAEVGDYDRTLPVLGDWEFNIRFLQKYNIGVLPELLANYHHREQARRDDVYGNSIIAGIDQHMLYDAVIRNKMLRYDLEKKQLGVGCLMSILRWHQKLLNEQRALSAPVRAAKRILKCLPGSKCLIRWFAR